jgi:hypothetical protein
MAREKISLSVKSYIPGTIPMPMGREDLDMVGMRPSASRTLDPTANPETRRAIATDLGHGMVFASQKLASPGSFESFEVWE